MYSRAGIGLVAKNPLFPGRTNIVQTVKGFSECDLFTILYDLCTGIHVNCDNFNLRIKKRYIQCYLVEARCVYFWEGGGFPILPPPLFQNQAETDSEHSTHSAYSITAHPLHNLSQHTLCIPYHSTPSAYSITAHPLHTLSQHTLCILYHSTRSAY